MRRLLNIVNQLHRSPGLAFEATQHPNGKILHSFRIIPDRGSWYEAQFDTSDLLYVYLDRKKRRRKFLTTTFFRALTFLDEGGLRVLLAASARLASFQMVNVAPFIRRVLVATHTTSLLGEDNA